MGCFDAYCALCGGPLCNRFSGYGAEEIEAEEAETGERQLFQDDESPWLDNCRIVGFRDPVGDPNGEAIPQVLIVEASETSSGAFVTTLGSGGNYGNLTFNHIYESASLDIYVRWRFATHDACWELLKRALRIHGDVRLDVVVAYITSKIDYSGGPVTAIYSTLDSLPGFAKGLLQGQSWGGNLTSEAWLLTDFEECPGLEEYLEDPPTVGASRMLPPSPPPPPPPVASVNLRGIDNEDAVLAILPPELLVKILCMLPRQDACNLRIASRAVAALPLVQEFWKCRFLLDVPWLWEVHEVAGVYQHVKLDWARMYKDLVVETPMAPEWRGLRNRRRVWEVVLGVAEKCWAGELKEREKPGCYVRRRWGAEE